MRRLIALAASIAVNVALLSALQLNVYLDQAPPPGEVSITELVGPASTYAQTAAGRDLVHQVASAAR